MGIHLFHMSFLTSNYNIMYDLIMLRKMIVDWFLGVDIVNYANSTPVLVEKRIRVISSCVHFFELMLSRFLYVIINILYIPLFLFVLYKALFFPPLSLRIKSIAQSLTELTLSSSKFLCSKHHQFTWKTVAKKLT